MKQRKRRNTPEERFTKTPGPWIDVIEHADAVLLRPLPYVDPQRLVVIESGNKQVGAQQFGGGSPADFWDWQEQSQASGMTASDVIAVQHRDVAQVRALKEELLIPVRREREPHLGVAA